MLMGYGLCVRAGPDLGATPNPSSVGKVKALVDKQPVTPKSDYGIRVHAMPNSTILQACGLLVMSNVFMTFAWYAHLRDLKSSPWYLAVVVSWGIAAFEYLLQVPANRIGYTAMSLAQLKILQEAITLTVFVPFALFYMRQPLRWDYLWAALCIVGAVFFIFRPDRAVG